jgi:ethylmalonyl-CoA/methylmalonyl-CoA decarboxylase
MFLQRATNRVLSLGKTVTRSLALAGENKRFLREKFKNLGGGDVLLQRLDYHGHNIAVISLANPKNRNALSGKMMVQLAEIVDELQQWSEGKAVILRGVENTFCSGADLVVARNILTHEEGEMMCTLMHDTVLRFKYLPLISVAVAEGQSLGGGAEASVEHLKRTDVL